MARALSHELILLHVVEIPDPRLYAQGTAQAIEARQRLARTASEGEGTIRPLIRVGENVPDEIRRAAHLERADLLLCGWGEPVSPDGEFGPVTESLLENPPCDLAVIHPPEEVRSILVAVRGGPYAVLAAELGAHLASAGEAEMETLHIYHREGVEESLLPEASRRDLLILGYHGPPETTVIRFNRLRQMTGKGIMVVRTRQPLSSWMIEPPAWSPALVDKWIAENTFEAREFSDLHRLVRAKEQQNLTTSLCLPTLNEAETIGPLIQVMRKTLQETVPLLDEMVVVDSGSEDGTPEIARSLGVPVYQHSEVLPHYGSHRGKGEALWKSLYLLQGDLIVWLDTDIKNPAPHMVYGLLGPLLLYPRLKYVKGYYSRPIKIGDQVYESGGGRVTELTARPLLNLFFPELSGFIQPLAGQCAGRREVLERVPFFTGYGVETGLLIDLLAGHGLEAMAQVNLGRVVHRNQPLARLSPMAFAILQVIAKRLESLGRLTPTAEAHRALKLIRWERDRLVLEIQEIEEAERPPMATVPEYRSRHP